MNDKVKPLIEQLKDPYFRTRERAVEALMELRGEARNAVPVLIEALNDRSWRVRAAVVRTLSEIGHCLGANDKFKDEILLELTNLILTDSSWNVTLAAIDAIVSFGSESEFAIPFLLPSLHEFMREEDEEIRIHIIEALRRLGTREPEAIEALVEALADSSVNVRREAARALVELGWSDYESLPALIKASEDPDEFVRGPVYRLLGRLASAPNVIPLLMKALKDEGYYQFVVEALAEAGSLAADALAEALKNPDVGIRRRAAYALKQMGTQARETIPTLVRALEDPDSAVRWNASDALASIGISAASALIEALKTPDEELQERIIETLGKIGIEVVPILIRAIEIKEESQRMKIAKALHRLGPKGILEILRIVDETKFKPIN